MATHSKLGTKRCQVPYLLNRATNRRAETPFSRPLRGSRSRPPPPPSTGLWSPCPVLRRKGGWEGSQVVSPHGDRDLFPSLRRRGCPPAEGKSGGPERITCRDWKSLREGEAGIPSPAGKLVNCRPMSPVPRLVSPGAQRLALLLAWRFQEAGSRWAVCASRNHGVEGLERKG